MKKNWLRWTGMLCVLNLTPSFAQIERTNDSLQLVALYNATGGANWTIKTNWLSAQPMNTWYGIRLNVAGRVDAIDLDGIVNFVRETGPARGNNLVGTLPNLNLPTLSRLYVAQNQLSGAIPNFNLPLLNALDLEGNQYAGSLPNFNLPQLSYFNAVFNQLTGSIPTFSGTVLETLYLAFNNLSGPIPNFNLPNLRYLALQHNRLTGSIPTFSGTVLESISVWDNQLTGTIPHFNLPSISYVHVAFNQLTGPIPHFNLPLLEQIIMRDNQLSGSIPKFNLPKLKTLDLQNNQLSGCIPRELKGNCPLIGASGGVLSNNAGLTTQDWASYWNLGTGSCTTGIQAMSWAEVRWSIFPNPTSGFLTIQAPQALGKVELYDSVGNLLQIKETNAEETSFDLSGYAAGLYVVKCGNQHLKIAKQ